MVFWDLITFRCGVFRGKVVIFLARSYFLVFFWLSEFELDLLL